MYINDGFVANIIPLSPRGTNSTFFTECCDVAICNDQADCPKCKRHVIGHNESADERSKTRWMNATRYWKR